MKTLSQSKAGGTKTQTSPRLVPFKRQESLSALSLTAQLSQFWVLTFLQWPPQEVRAAPVCLGTGSGSFWGCKPQWRRPGPTL